MAKSPQQENAECGQHTSYAELGQHSVNPQTFVAMPGKAHDDTKDPN